MSAALGLALILAVNGAAQNQASWTADDVLTARDQASPRVRCIIDFEVSGFGFDPYHNGSSGERGPAQLHPQGKLLTFYAQGYTDPHNPYQAVEFLERQLAAGQGAAWSPVARGLC